MSDLELLRQCQAGDADALSALAQRHYGWVYASARRQVGNAHSAQDVAQDVFVVLMQKAPGLRTDSVLAAWLFAVTRSASKRELRSQRRRAFHEGRAGQTRPIILEADQEQIAWREILAHLDDAVARLSQSDREAVLLRFYQSRTFVEVGSAMGISEEAARKRVNRALDRLRDKLSRRGVSITSTALGPAILQMLRESSAVKVPAIPHAGHASGVLAKGVMHMIWTTQAKLATAIVLTAIVSAGTTTVIMTTFKAAPTSPASVSAPGAPSSSKTSTPTLTQSGPIIADDLLEIGIDDLMGPGITTMVVCRVDPQLRVRLPLVKLVSLAGTTLPEAELRIGKAYDDGHYMTHAQASVRRLESGLSPSVRSGPIQVGDALHVELYGLQAANKTSVVVKPVSPNGTVQLPYVGPVLVRDLTEADADLAIEKAYEKGGFMRDAMMLVRRISQEEAARPSLTPDLPSANPAALK